MSDTLTLIVAETWFGLMAAGIKPEEFRRDCQFWRNRLCVYRGGFPREFRHFETILIVNGYGKTRPRAEFRFGGIRWQSEGVERIYRISDDRPAIELKMPGALFVIKLGERVG